MSTSALTGEKCELLLPNALSFLKFVRNISELGIEYLHWLYRAISFVSLFQKVLQCVRRSADITKATGV